MLKLEAQKRDNQKLEALRAEGFVPAVFYGKGIDSVSISIKASDLEKVMKEAGKTSVINLSIDGDEKDVLIHDADIDPERGFVRHVDFYVMDKNAKIEVAIPLEFIGESPAVKNLGGILVKIMHEINVETLPKDLPKSIEVDISALTDLDSVIEVKDVKLPDGVETTDEPQEAIASISVATEEKEEEQRDISDVEIEEKGKKVEEESEDK